MKFDGFVMKPVGYEPSPPSRGAWIEILVLGTPINYTYVAPLAGGVD